MTRFGVKLFIATAALSIAGMLVSNPAFSKSHHPRHRHHSHCHRLVWDGDYEIQNLDDINAISGYTVIKGNLSMTLGENVPSLEGLECLRHISGDLKISYDAFSDSGALPKNLYGLNNLESVAGTLKISFGSSDVFLSLEGLDNLKTVGNLELTAGCAAGVSSLRGLENLKVIKGILNIYEMDWLKNLEGLGKLREIGKCLVLDDNGSFENFIGLDSLRFLGGISIDEQSGPQNFLGLGNLKSIGSMFINGAGDLENFEGLNNLESITGFLQVDMTSDYYGPGLTSLDGLENLRYVGGDFSFRDNSNLCTGLVEDLRDQVLDSGGIGGNIYIDSNKDCD